MGRKRKHFDYRQFYREYYGIDFGPEMAVHHIDFNHENNSIDNLLLMPKKLHAKYHFAVSCLNGSGTGEVNESVKLNWIEGVCMQKSRFKTLYEALDELEPWLAYKKSLEMDRFNRLNQLLHQQEAVNGRS